MNHSRVHTSNHHHHDMHHHHHQPIASTVQHDHSMMQMYFHTGYLETILFEQWKTTSVPVFIASWILIYICGILYEGIKEFRVSLEEERLSQTSAVSELTPETLDDDKQTELERLNAESSKAISTKQKKKPVNYTQQLLLSCLYTLQLVLSYLLMLIAMTFNIYLFFAIILGVGTGHFLYVWTRPLLTDTDKTSPHG